MDELRRRSVAADIESQTSRPMPREINPYTLIATVIAVVATAIWIWFGT
jgi:hypothetical protein